jgi:hypothetical protein
MIFNSECFVMSFYQLMEWYTGHPYYFLRRERLLLFFILGQIIRGNQIF